MSRKIVSPRTRGVVASACSCEALEARRLLTYTLFGTEGNDVFQVQPGSAYTITLNGSPVTTAGDINVILTGLGGHDTFLLSSVPWGSITVRGGPGDDTVEVGTGNLSDQLRAHVYIEEFAGEGNDSFIAHDQADTADNYVRIRDNLLTSSVATAGAHYDDNVEVKSLFSSNAADTVYVESPPAGMNLFLGGGDDYVRFGSLTAHDLPDFMAPGTVSGGSGNDHVYFEDDGQNDGGFLEYLVTPTRFLNQQLIGVEHGELKVRHSDVIGEDNDVTFTGTGGVTDLISVSSVNLTTIEIGTAQSPVDIDELGITLDVSVDNVELHDQDFNASNQIFDLYKASGSRPLRLQKGGLILRMGDLSQPSISRLEIYGGSTNDNFAISGKNSFESIHIDGGGGNDFVYTSNVNGLDNDLDAVFAGGSFYFTGGPGYDTFDLDDSADQTGDGDEIYYLGFDRNLTKGGQQIVGYNGRVAEGEQVEHIRLVTDSDPNTIYFGSQYGYFLNQTDFTLNGGPGNDYFTNYYPGGTGGNMSDSRFNATIIGGAGSDTIALDDTLNNGTFSGAGSYHFRSDYRLDGPSDATYDATTEFLTLEANDIDNAIQIDAKPLNMQFVVNGRGGNDSFTVGGGDIDSRGFSLSNTTVTGGAGEDSMRFDDRFDTDPGSETETYLQTALASVNKLSKGGFGLNYTTVESFTLDLANGTVGAQSAVDLRSFSSLITAVTVNGGSAAFNTVNIGSTSSGNIDTLVGPVFNVNLAGGSDTVNLYNQASTFVNVYELRTNQLVRAAGQSQQFVVNHSGIEEFNVRAGSNGDFFYLFGSAPGSGLFAYGNGGNDTFWIDDTWASIAGVAFFLGGAGSDHMISATSSAVAHSGIVTDTSVAVNASPAQSYFECEHLTANFGSGSANVNVKSLSTFTEMTVPGPNSAIAIGDGNVQANIRGALNLNTGISVSSVITFDDRLDAGNDSYFFDPNLTFYKRDAITNVQTPLITGGGFLGRGTQILLANNGDNQISCNTIVENLRIFAHGGNDTINVLRGTAIVDTGAENAGVFPFGDTLQLNPVSGQSPVMRMASVIDRVHAVHVQQRGTLQVPVGSTLDVTGVVAIQGVIDMNGGAMILRNAANEMNAVKNLLKVGRANGAWNGSTAIDGTATAAINSSLAASSASPDAVGYARGSDLFGASGGTFAGVAIDANCLVWRYAMCGDADLNGVVNFDDYSRIDHAFNTNAAGEWFRGDFDYNSAINFDDYALIDLAFNSQRRTGERGIR